MTFSAKRWARAFLNVSGDDWQAGFNALSAFCSATGESADSAASGGRRVISGKRSAERAAAILSAAVKKSGGEGSSGTLAAEAVLALLIQRGLFKMLSAVTAAVLEAADEKNGILTVRLEAAAEFSGEFLDELKAALIAQTGRRDARFDIQIMPELIAGYRITMLGERRDFSLRGQAAQLENTLRNNDAV